jgi:catechol 2,3-dioxygenase-like lactoylglutathione lyase family enzyme
MKVTDIAFTVYPVTDLKRARQFYETILGLKESRFFGNESKALSNTILGRGHSRSVLERRSGSLHVAEGRWLSKSTISVER